MVNEDQDNSKKIKNGVQNCGFQKSADTERVDTEALWRITKAGMESRTKLLGLPAQPTKEHINSAVS